MEVHHHPHADSDSHRKKKFKEYFLEFLMIFLAVTMGFFAENIRERIGNREIEKKNMETILSNLKSDTAALVSVININLSRSTALDSIEMFRYQNLTDSIVLKKFMSYYSQASSFSYFKPSSSAFEQMKSADGFRLVKNREILDSLFGYYDFIKVNLDLQSDYADHFMRQIFDLSHKMFDPGKLPETGKVIGRNPDLMRKMFNVLAELNINLSIFYTRDLKIELKKALTLITMIQQ